MASSITKPTEMVSAISVKLLSENPASHMHPSVPSSDSGTATPAARMAEGCRRNSATTSTTSTMLMIRACSTSFTEARMVSERSRMTVTSMPAGIQRCRSGSRSRMPSTTSSTFASACLKTVTITAGRPLYRPVWRRSRGPWSTRATPSRRTSASPWRRTMMAPNSSGVVSRSFTDMVAAWSGPSMKPVAWVTLARAMAVRIWSKETPAAAAAAGSTETRMAGCSAPDRLTCAVPGTCAMRGASRLSAAS